jgi:glycine cleavage system H protein
VEYRYTEEHEYIRVENGEAVIGISDYAQKEMGDIVYVELPSVGTSIHKGDTFGTVESVKSVSDLYAPLSGEVIELNPRVESTPQIVNEDAEGEGWMLKIKLDDVSELDDLMDAKEYRRFVGQEEEV